MSCIETKKRISMASAISHDWRRDSCSFQDSVNSGFNSGLTTDNGAGSLFSSEWMEGRESAVMSLGDWIVEDDFSFTPLQDDSSQPFPHRDVPLGKEIQIEITWVKSPSEFFGHLEEGKDKFRKVMQEAQSLFCGSKLRKNVAFKEGDAVMAMYAVDECWYRAVVREVLSSSKVSVFFVDYGNEETVPLTKVSHIEQKHLLEMPAQALHCSVDSICPMSGNDWSAAAIQQAEAVLMRSPFVQCCISEKKGHISQIDKVITSDKKDYCRVLVNNGYAAYSRPPTQDLDYEKTVVMDHLEVSVVGVSGNDRTVWLRAADKWEVLTDLKSSINLQAKSASVCKNIAVGMPCLAQSSVDSTWYRSKVEACTGEAALVLFVDYGRREETSVDKIREISKNLIEMMPMSRECFLKKKHWSYDQELKQEVYIVQLHGEENGRPVVALTAKDITHNGNRVSEKDDHRQIKVSVISKCSVDKNREHYENDSVRGSLVNIRTEPLRVVHVTDDGIVWVQQCTHEDDLNALMDELDSYCNGEGAENIVTFAQVKEENVYGCLYKVDEGWYRARVVKLLEEEMCEVHYIDYGNNETVSCDSLRVLSVSQLQLEPQAIGCILKGWKPSVMNKEKLKSLIDVSEIEGQLKGGSGKYRYLQEVMVGDKPFLIYPDDMDCEVDIPVDHKCRNSNETSAYVGNVCEDSDTDSVFERKENCSNLNGSQPEELRSSGNATTPLSCSREEGFSLVAVLSNFQKKNGNGKEMQNGKISCDAKALSHSFEENKEYHSVGLDKLAVVHVSEDGIVWVQKCVQEEALNSMMDELHNFCTESGESLAYGEVVEGELYGCLYEGDNGWYRARVVRVLDEKRCEVHYIDYGNAEIVLYEVLRVLPAGLRKLEAQAIGCKFDGSKPLLDIDKLKGLVEMTDIKGQLKGRSDEYKYLDNLLVNGLPFIAYSDGQDCGLAIPSDQKSKKSLENANEGLHCNETIKEDTDDFSGFTAEEKSYSRTASAVLISCNDNSEVEGIVPQTAVSDSEDADSFLLDESGECHSVPSVKLTVVHISSDGVLWVQKRAQEHSLNSLMDDLHNYCITDQKKMQFEDVMEGGLYGCLYEVDEGWYRVRVVSRLDDGRVDVHYIDYGNMETVSCELLCELPEPFMELEPQAIRCHLSGLKPSSLDLKKLKGLMEGYEILGQLKESGGIYKHLKEVEIDGKSLIAFAYEQECGIDTSCNQQSGRSYSKVMCTENTGGEEIDTEIDEENNTRSFSDGDIEQDESTPNQGLVKTFDRNPASLLKEGSNDLRVIEEKEKVKGDEECFTAKSEKLTVVHVSSDGIVWIQRSSQEEALFSLMDELHMHCTEDRKSLAHEEVEEGELYGCLYEADDSWYRSRVLRLLDDERCEVHYIDYGNTEAVYCEALRALPAHLLELESQAVGCKLRISGCSQMCIEKLKGLMEASEIYGQVKEGKGKYKELEEVIVDGKPFLLELEDEIKGTSYQQSVCASSSAERLLSGDKIIDEEDTNDTGCTGEERNVLCPREEHPVRRSFCRGEGLSAEKDYENARLLNGEEPYPDPAEESGECFSGDSEKLVVAHVSSDDLIWIQRCSQEEDLHSLMDELHTHCEGGGESAGKKVQEGEVYGCIYEADGGWYRARVVSLLDDKKCEVHYIDYGNMATVSTEVLCVLPEPLSSLGPQAIGCRLRDATEVCVDKLKSLAEYGSEIEGHMIEGNEYRFLEKVVVDGKPLLTSQGEQSRNSSESVLSIETTDGVISGSGIVIEEITQSCDVIVDSEQSKSLNDDDLNAKFIHLKLEGDLENSLTKIEIPYNTEPSPPSVEKSKSFNRELEHLFAVYVSLDGVVWVQKCAQEQALYSLMSELESHCTADRKTVTLEEVEEGKLYGCLYEEDRSWYRGRVVKLLDVKRCEVHYIDYGNTDTVLYEDLRVLPAPLLKLEPQADGCELNGFRSLLNVEKLKVLLEGMELYAVIKEGSGKYKCLEKIMINGEPFSAFVNEHDIAIDLLSDDSRTCCDVSEGSTGNYSNIMDSDDSSLFCTDNLPVPLTPGNVPSLDTRLTGLSLRTDSRHGVDMKLMEENTKESCPSLLKENTECLSTEVEPLKVVYVSPDGILWVHRCAQEQVLHSLIDELRACEVGSRRILTFDEIKEGNVYGCICKADKRCYRVRVLAFLSDGRCEVHYIDYGSMETVSFESLGELPATLVGLEPQAVACKIKGLKPDTSVPQQVKELVYASDVMGKMKVNEGDFTYLEEITVSGEQFLPSVDYGVNGDKDDKSVCECETNIEIENTDTVIRNIHLGEEKRSACDDGIDITEDDLPSSISAPVSVSTPKGEGGPTETVRNFIELENIEEEDRACKDVEFYGPEVQSDLVDDSVVEPLTVTHVSCDKIIWVQRCAQDEIIYSMMDELYNYCTSDDKNVKYEDMKVGNIYGCLCEAFQGWYRARVTALLDGRKCQICYIDYGNVETVSCEVLRDLPPHLCALEPFAVSCMLDSLEPGSREEEELVNLKFATDVKGRIKEAEGPYKELVDLQVEGKLFSFWAKCNDVGEEVGATNQDCRNLLNHEQDTRLPQIVRSSNFEEVKNDRNEELGSESSPVPSADVVPILRPNNEIEHHKDGVLGTMHVEVTSNKFLKPEGLDGNRERPFPIVKCQIPARISADDNEVISEGKKFRDANEKVADLEEEEHIYKSEFDEDSTSDFEHDSLEVEQDSLYFKQGGSDLEQEGLHLEQESSYSEEDTYFEQGGSHCEEDSSHFEEDSSHFEEDSSHFKEDCSHLKEGSSHSDEEDLDFEQDGLDVEQKGSHYKEDNEHCKEGDFAGESSQLHMFENVQEPVSYDGFIVHIEVSPLTIWLQTTNAYHNLSEWESLTHDELEKFEKLMVVAAGEKCLAPLWYTTQRACIERVFSGDDHVQVFYIDQGKYGVVLKDELRKLPSYMETIPPLAFKRILPITMERACEAYALNMLRNIVINNKCVCVDLDGMNGTPHLVDSNGNMGVSVWTDVGDLTHFLAAHNFGSVWDNPGLDEISHWLAFQAEKNCEVTEAED